jgi:LuxR family transcriptional regulator, maltose regulon positive regulatory protein
MSPVIQHETADIPVMPDGRNGVVARSPLLRRLRDAERVVQISAPAGSGKTVLLRSWIHAEGLAGSVAWVPVERAERDPRRFWVSVERALRGTTAGSKLVRPLTTVAEPNGEETVRRLLEDLGPLWKPLWLVIDDLHELQSQEAQRGLELLLTRAPQELRFVLATRRDLRLGLHRLRLEGAVTDIRAADLRFTLEEARTLLDLAGVQVSDSSLALLLDRTEGWAAGLRFAALSLAGHPDPERFVADFSGGEPTVAEYLQAEVLDRQTDPVRRLLRRTSMLEQVNGELADLMTGDPGGQRILQELEEVNAFVSSVDMGRTWFRYHKLFADLLQLQLRRREPGELPKLHDTAAQWYADHGYQVEAIRHAEAASDQSLATRLRCDDRGGRVQVALAMLRLSHARRHCDLSAVAEEVPRLLAFAEDPDWAFGPRDDLHALTLISLGIGELCTGQLPGAERHLERGLALARQIGQPSLELEGLAHRATIAMERSFVVAAELSTEAIELARVHGWSDEPVTAVACAAHGHTMVWQGRLTEAESWLDRAERALQAGAEPAAGILLHSARGMLELTRGRAHEALAAFRGAQRLAERLAPAHPLTKRTQAGLLHTLLRLGETECVEAAISGLDPCQRDAAEMRTVLAALRLAQDDPRAAAEALVPVLGAFAPLPDADPTLVQTFLLETIIREAQGDTGAAERALERALQLAEADGVVLPFLLHPAPRLLERQRRADPAHAAFISRILDLLAETARPEAERARPERPEDPLTDGEIRVLRYLPTHLTAPEIARQLFLSVHTVTTHMRHIYAKLGVHRRHEAVDRARARGLLEPVARGTLRQSPRWRPGQNH